MAKKIFQRKSTGNPDRDRRAASVFAELDKKIFGQEDLKRILADDLAGIASDRAAGKNASSSFLFYSPASGGKTHAANVMAEILDIPVFIWNVGEDGAYSDEFLRRQLLGAPGVDDDPVLKLITDEPRLVRIEGLESARDPVLAVIADVLLNKKVLLANDKIADFSNTIIVVTSNEAKRKILARLSAAAKANERDQAKQPAFFARITPEEQAEILERRRAAGFFDTAVPLSPLDKAAIKKIVERDIQELATALNHQYDCLLDIVPTRIDQIVEKAYADAGRPASRAAVNIVREEIRKPLEAALLKHLADKNAKPTVFSFPAQPGKPRAGNEPAP